MKWLQKLARPRVIWLSIAAVLLCEGLFLALFQRLRAHGVATTLDLMVGFSYPEARAHLALYSEPVKVLHNYFRLVDLAFPLAYGVAFASLVLWLRGKTFAGTDRGLLLGLVPAAATVSDLTENTGIYAMVSIYPEPFATISRLTSAAGVIKMAFFYASVLTILVLAVILLIQRLRARQEPAARR